MELNSDKGVERRPRDVWATTCEWAIGSNHWCAAMGENASFLCLGTGLDVSSLSSWHPLKV